MKKIGTLLLAVCLCSYASSAYAAGTADAFIDEDGNVNVNIISDTQNEALFTVYITEADAELADAEGENTISGIMGIEQTAVIPSVGKKYSQGTAAAKISNTAPGTKYNIVIGGDDLYGKVIPAVYPTDVEAAIAELNAADEKSVYSVLEKWQDRAWLLETDNPDFIAYKSRTVKNLSVIMKNASDISDVYRGFTNSHQLAALYYCDKNEVYDILLKNEYNFGLSYSSYILSESKNALDAFVNLRADEELNPLTETEELSLVLRKAEALGRLNESTRESVIRTLKTFDDVFMLDFSGNYLKADPYEVAKQMTPNGRPYTCIEEVREKFDRAITPASDNKKPSGGTSGGGGGTSGGGVSGGTVTSDTIKNVASVEEFDDINEAQWAITYIRYMQDRKIISGDGNGRVRPNDAVTREEFLKIILEAFRPEISEEGSALAEFEDVDDDEWYADYIKKAYKLGIVNGVGDKHFGIGEKITRQDAAVMLHRVSDIMKLILKSSRPEATFEDADEISDYAARAVGELYAAEIISGYRDGSFAPLNAITRAESAKLVYSLLKHTDML